MAEEIQQASSCRTARCYFEDCPRTTQTFYDYFLLRPWRLGLGLNRRDVGGKFLGLRSREIEFGSSRVILVQELAYCIKIQIPEGHFLLCAGAPALNG